MKELIFKYKNYFLITLGLLTIIFLLLGNKKNPLPQIINFTPADGSQNIELRAIPSYLSDIPLTLSDLTITTTPPHSLTLTSSNPTMITATHSLAFQPATTYTITLSWRGNILQAHSFTTVKSQEDPLLIQNMKDELARDYPLAQKLPLNTSQFRVVYSAPMTLEITIKNPNLTSQEAIDEIMIWVKKSGGDVEAHKYTTSSDKPTPKPSSGSLSTSPLR